MFETDYPDILGTLTDGRRCEMDTLQCVAGVYPPRSAVGQPFETLIVLQSKIDSPQEIALEMRLPRKDSKTGHRLSFFTPRKRIKITLGAGEVGVMYLPVRAQPPTPPASAYPLMVRVLAKAPRQAGQIRGTGMGRPPSALSISPFRLEVLREIGFSGATNDTGVLRCQFEVIPGMVRTGLLQPPEPRYESLWTTRDFELERSQVGESVAIAERIAERIVRGEIFAALRDATEDRFAQAGMVLHPAEALFIAKALCYVFEDAYQFERNYELHDARWFQWLCSLLVREPGVVDRDLSGLVAGELYLGALYDAVWVLLPMLQNVTRQTFGTVAEHKAYANRVMQAVQGNELGDLSYVYLPLVMAGVQLNMRMGLRYEDLWENLDLIQEAMLGRVRLSTGDENEIFVAMNRLLEDASELLRRSRVERFEEDN